MKFHNETQSAARPDWTYSVPPPRVLSPFWVLEVLATLSVPIAGVCLLAAAISLGWINLN